MPTSFLSQGFFEIILFLRKITFDNFAKGFTLLYKPLDKDLFMLTLAYISPCMWVDTEHLTNLWLGLGERLHQQPNQSPEEHCMQYVSPFL